MKIFKYFWGRLWVKIKNPVCIWPLKFNYWSRSKTWSLRNCRRSRVISEGLFSLTQCSNSPLMIAKIGIIEISTWNLDQKDALTLSSWVPIRGLDFSFTLYFFCFRILVVLASPNIRNFWSSLLRYKSMVKVLLLTRSFLK